MFVLAAETGSFSACARALGKVQSAVSQGIANLEVDLNVQLFDRSTRKPGLTPQGARLLDYARAVLIQAREMETAITATDLKQEISLVLLVDSALMLPALTQILADFAERFPATSLELRCQPSSTIAASLQQSEADMGLMFTELALQQDLDVCFIGNLEFHAVCAPEHPLARLDTIGLKDLLQHRQILQQGQGQAVESYFPKISTHAWWANHSQIALTWLIAGLGWAYLPLHQTREEIDTQRLTQLNIEIDHKPWNPPVDLVKAKNKPTGPAGNWLFQSLKEVLPQQSE